MTDPINAGDDRVGKNNVAGAWTLAYMGGKYSTRKTGMVVGKTYAFRVSAVGGEGGMSPFCPEVWRAAA